jgi:hypothetical protein
VKLRVLTMQLAAGVTFKGPMGISLLWCFFQAIPPFLLVLHRCMNIRHEVHAHSSVLTPAPGIGQVHAMHCSCTLLHLDQHG